MALSRSKWGKFAFYLLTSLNIAWMAGLFIFFLTAMIGF
jgi:hypothetical protein